MNTFSNIAVVVLLLFALWFTVSATNQRRLMVASLGRPEFRSSQIITCINAYKSSMIWFQIMAGASCLIWAIYKWCYYFMLGSHEIMNIGSLLLPTLGLVFGLIVFANQLRPAAVIVLGKSTSSRLRLQQQLLEETAPFRTVSLLEQKAAGDNLLAAGHCFRTSIGSWEKSISSFASVAGVVILDLREGSSYVDIESNVIRSLDLGYKTLIIPPAAEFDASQVPRQAKVVESEDEVVQIVKKCLFEPGRRASRSRPISSWA
jgi:hypothetical protein